MRMGGGAVVQPVDVAGAPLPPWYPRLTSELDAADARAIAIAHDLSTSQLNWTPRPGAWSIGQCLEHLCLSNEVYVRPLTEALQRGASGYAHEIEPGWFGRWFLRTYIEPTTQKRRHRAPPRTVPIASQLDSSILDRFLASNARMRELAARAQRHDVNRLRFRNPFVPLIRFTVGTGLQIIARHNHRHLLQAERVKHDPGFPPITRS
jgi:hypothetical protein